jgi:hypothetical protein
MMIATFDPRDIALPGGYRIEIVATGLNMPSGVAFDADGSNSLIRSSSAGRSSRSIVTSATPTATRAPDRLLMTNLCRRR